MEIIADRFPANVPGMKLNNGAVMPQLGLGVFHLNERDDAYNAVLTALKDGYRHIDTAHAYQNERSVGRAVMDSGIPRGQIWITSKLWPNEYGPDETPAALERMRKRLSVDYIDMVYLHQPVGDYIVAYKVMEQELRDGKLRAIGISDFDYSDELYHSIVDHVELAPDCFQMECHPWAQRRHWQELLEPTGTVLEAWFPLGGRESNNAVLGDSTLKAIAKVHGKTVAQIILRWHVQEGHSVVPGSHNPIHIKENLDIFDFELSDEEMNRIRSIDKEQRVFTETLPTIQKWFSEYKLVD